MGTASKSFALVLVALFLTSLVALPSITLGETTWDTQIIDTHGYFGKLAFDSNDNPHIIYNTYSNVDDSTKNSLSYAFWTGKNWSTQNIDSTGIVGVLSLDSSGKPHVLYRNNLSNNNLEYVVWTGSNWTFHTLPASRVDSFLNGYAMAIDSNGKPHVVYSSYRYSNDTYTTDLNYAEIKGSNWVVQTIETMKSNISYGFFPTSIILDSKEYPHILYRENQENLYYSESLKRERAYPANDIKYAKWTGSSWIIQTLVVNESNTDVGAIGNLVLDSKEQPHLCYIHRNLTYSSNYGSFLVRYSLEYVYLDGSAWANRTVESSLDHAVNLQKTFLRLDGNDNPQIYFYKQDYQTLDIGFKYAKWTGSNWNIQTIGSRDYADIAFDSQGNIHVIYDMQVGTIHGAPILGNLTYASLENPLFSSSILVGIIVAVGFAITIAIVSLLLFRRHRKAISQNKPNV
jgi:hypothetical protein